jgi:hypothetical protein
MSQVPLYIHVGKATHFARWEIPEFARFFDIVDSPSPEVPLLSFGPDVFAEAAELPASSRFAVVLPGFSFNPVRDLALREHQLELIRTRFAQVFINAGPLEIAYRGEPNVMVYPASVDMAKATVRRYRTTLNSLLHVSQDNPQKDWRRSEAIMHKTGLKYEVFPRRDQKFLVKSVSRIDRRNARLSLLGKSAIERLPIGYVSHEATIAKYQDYDGFVHVARDVRHPEFIDGMYTATFIEAGATGAILFWHDTWRLGTPLETIFTLPLDTAAAAREILDIRASIDVAAHSRRTREEMLDSFNPRRSVTVRAERMLSLL